MTGISRRTTVKRLFSIPVIGATVQWLSNSDAEAHQPPQTPEYKRRAEAVQILRTINTVEQRARAEGGSFATLAALERSAAVSAWLDSPAADKRGIGRAVYRGFDFGSTEIVPGWRCTFRATSNGDRYTLLLSDSSGKLASFGTDEKGVIHEGALAAVKASGEWVDAATAIVGAPIGKRPDPVRRSPVTGFLHWVATSIVMPVEATHCSWPNDPGDCCCSGVCCHDFGCSIGYMCSCQTGCGCPTGYQCDNCGCQCCPWVCCRNEQ